ncbi:SUMF1/EgtB/PvdO family nonheme iron enzyme [Prosthecobacter sp.]|uniref:formylglycine-generating enzyme family protein n=1 Tax=Prosthecobacter sp. TaxID=1965333 RepID=UPI003782EB68
MPDPSPTFDSFWKERAPGADAALRLRHARTLAAAVAQQKSVSKHVWEDSTVLENGDLNLPAGLSCPMDADQFAKSATDKLRHLIDGVNQPWASASRPLLDAAPIDWQNLLSALERNYLPPDPTSNENGDHRSEGHPRRWPLILLTVTCLGVSAWLFLANPSSNPPASTSTQAAATPHPQPAPVTKPEPAPAPVTVTKPEPKPTPPPQPAPKVAAVTKPEPTPAPQPTPVTKPEAAPTPAPQPAPMVAAVTKPEPVPEPKAAPAPAAATKPEPKPTPAPQPAPVVAAVTKPESAPEPKAAPAPAAATKPEPKPTPAPQPAPMVAAATKPEPAPEPKAAPVPAPATKPESKPTPAPSPQPAPMVAAATKPEPTSEPKAGPAPVPLTKPEPAPPAPKPTPMLTALARPEPAPVPKAEPVAKPQPAPAPASANSSAPAPDVATQLAGVWQSKGPHAQLKLKGGSLPFHQIASKRFAITMSSLELDEVGPALAIPPVFLSETEITHAQWRLIDPTPRDLGEASNPDAAVTNVTWQEADEWCKKLQQALPKDAPLIVRLPWQYEWELAARQEYTELKMEFEDDWLPKALVFGKADGHLPSARDAAPSSLGLRGLLGNVSEWMGDAEVGDSRAQPALGHSKDQGSHQHICRGGSVQDFNPSFVARYLYISPRVSDSSRSPLRGFRVAVSTP